MAAILTSECVACAAAVQKTGRCPVAGHGLSNNATDRDDGDDELRCEENHHVPPIDSPLRHVFRPRKHTHTRTHAHTHTKACGNRPRPHRISNEGLLPDGPHGPSQSRLPIKHPRRLLTGPGLAPGQPCNRAHRPSQIITYLDMGGFAVNNIISLAATNCGEAPESGAL